MQLPEIRGEDRVDARDDGWALADVDLLARGHGTIQQILRVARKHVDPKQHALAEHRTAKAGLDAKEGVGKRGHGDVPANEVQVFNRTVVCRRGLMSVRSGGRTLSV